MAVLNIQVFLRGILPGKQVLQHQPEVFARRKLQSGLSKEYADIRLVLCQIIKLPG